MVRQARTLLVALAAAALVGYLLAALSPAVEPPHRPGEDCGPLPGGAVPCWEAPLAFHLFFVHVPSAWAGYLGFGIVFVASAVHLRRKDTRWDRVAEGAAELGVLFTTIALVTGSVWMRAELGAFWRWEDPRLTTTLVMWLAYLTYLALRRGHLPEMRARASAAFGVVAFLTAPLSYASATVLRSSLHVPLSGTPSYLRGMNAPLLAVGAGVFTLLFAALLWIRRDLAELEVAVEVAKLSREGPA